MEAVDTDPEGPLTEEEIAWWENFRLWLDRMEKNRMTWQDTRRHLAEIRELDPEVADIIEENIALFNGDKEAPDGVEIIETTSVDIKATLDLMKRIAADLAEVEAQEAALNEAMGNAIADYYGGTK